MPTATTLSDDTNAVPATGAARLRQTRITALPESAYYIPDFISPDEEAAILHQITTAPIPRWTVLSRRRLQTYPSPLAPRTNTLPAGPLPRWLVEPVLPRLAALGVFSGSPHGAAPNQVLVNEYQPGQGIMPHEDGPAYWPVVATVSLGAPVVFDLVEKEQGAGERLAGERNSDRADEGKGDDAAERDGRRRFRILQEPRSLLVTAATIYNDFLHGIEERTVDDQLGPHSICNWELLGDSAVFSTGRYERQTRTSLTYRDVLKVSKFNAAKFLRP